MEEIDYTLKGDGSHNVVSYMRSSKALEYLNDNLYNNLTHIIILAQKESYEVQEDGHIIVSDGLIEILDQAVLRRGDRKTKLLLSFGGGNDFFIPLVQDSNKMINYLNDFKELCVNHGLDGADLDWEHPETSDQHVAASTFAEKMYEIFKLENLLLTQAIIWYNIGHMKAVEPYLDYINVMIYDNFDQFHCHSPYYDFTQFVDNILANGIQKEKVIAGLPFYGYVAVADWSQKGGYAYHSILNQYKPRIGEDVVYRSDGKAICFDGVVKVWKKCAYVLEKDLAGVFIWETWMDVPNFKSDSSLMFHVNSVFPVEN
ncbi:glycoside hydrolase family 18 protein [Bacteroidota bacterium]